MSYAEIAAAQGVKAPSTARARVLKGIKAAAPLTRIAANQAREFALVRLNAAREAVWPLLKSTPPAEPTRRHTTIACEECGAIAVDMPESEDSFGKRMERWIKRSIGSTNARLRAVEKIVLVETRWAKLLGLDEPSEVAVYDRTAEVLERYSEIVDRAIETQLPAKLANELRRG